MQQSQSLKNPAAFNRGLQLLVSILVVIYVILCTVSGLLYRQNNAHRRQFANSVMLYETRGVSTEHGMHEEKVHVYKNKPTDTVVFNLENDVGSTTITIALNKLGLSDTQDLKLRMGCYGSKQQILDMFPSFADMDIITALKTESSWSVYDYRLYQLDMLQKQYLNQGPTACSCMDEMYASILTNAYRKDMQIQGTSIKLFNISHENIPMSELVKQNLPESASRDEYKRKFGISMNELLSTKFEETDEELNQDASQFEVLQNIYEFCSTTGIPQFMYEYEGNLNTHNFLVVTVLTLGIATLYELKINRDDHKIRNREEFKERQSNHFMWVYGILLVIFVITPIVLPWMIQATRGVDITQIEYRGIVNNRQRSVPFRYIQVFFLTSQIFAILSCMRIFYNMYSKNYCYNMKDDHKLNELPCSYFDKRVEGIVLSSYLAFVGWSHAFTIVLVESNYRKPSTLYTYLLLVASFTLLDVFGTMWRYMSEMIHWNSDPGQKMVQKAMVHCGKQRVQILVWTVFVFVLIYNVCRDTIGNNHFQQYYEVRLVYIIFFCFMSIFIVDLFNYAVPYGITKYHGLHYPLLKAIINVIFLTWFCISYFVGDVQRLSKNKEL